MIKKVIYFLLSITIIGSLVFLIGFGGAFWITYNQESTPTLEEDEIDTSVNNENVSDYGYRILVLGDSLAKGTGDESGLGYSGHLNRELSEIVGVIEYENLGVDGMVSSEFLELVENPTVQEAISEADLILISIGGNDIRRLPVFQGISPGDFDSTKSTYLQNLSEILTIVREHNSEAKVAKLGLYNPFQEVLDEDTSALLHLWNFETLKRVETREGMVFVPTFDLFKYNHSLISIDMLHPNSEGYRKIAERHFKILKPVIEKR